MVYLLWLFCPLAAAFSFRTCARFSHFVFYGGFLCLSQYIPNGDEGREWLKKRNSEVVQKRKSEVISFWLESLRWLTMSLVLFCCPDARGGLIDLEVGFFFSTSFSKSKAEFSMCFSIMLVNTAGTPSLQDLLYNSLLLKKNIVKSTGILWLCFPGFY